MLTPNAHLTITLPLVERSHFSYSRARSKPPTCLRALPADFETEPKSEPFIGILPLLGDFYG
jgi:hypothetical protein